MSDTASAEIKKYIRDVPDFPKPGILFKDITPLLAEPKAFQATIDILHEKFKDEQIDVIVAAEARGFIFAAPLALAMNVSFVPIRKPGKLPFDSHSHDYDLEYGSDRLEIHVDGVKSGDRVLVLDDLLATGGTVDACIKLLEKCGATVQATAFIIELAALGGADRLAPHSVYSVLKYDD